MSITEYKAAVKQARRVLGWIAVMSNRPRPSALRLTKAAAQRLIAFCPDDAIIKAEWADDEHTILYVG